MFEIVRTILGDIPPEELGYTLTHEHLSMDFTHFYRKPPMKITNKFDGGFNLSNIGFIRQYPYSSKYNLLLDDNSISALLNDLKHYKYMGGGSIVENSTEGLNCNLDSCYELSEQTGVRIIMGTGFYIKDMQPANYLHYTIEDIYDHMKNDLIEGFTRRNEQTDRKAGVMGEIASVWPITDFERKVIRACGELQKEIGCGVSFHPHRHPDAPFEIIRLYLEAGGTASKAVMSHLDRTLMTDDEKLMSFAELGTYCQFDLFGTEVSYYQLNVDTDMPSDAQRLEKIKLLIDEGKADKVLMSHDIHTKHRLIQYGGHGYAHILTNVIPKMKSKGMADYIKTITVDNPAKWLAMSKP